MLCLGYKEQNVIGQTCMYMMYVLCWNVLFSVYSSLWAPVVVLYWTSQWRPDSGAASQCRGEPWRVFLPHWQYYRYLCSVYRASIIVCWQNKKVNWLIMSASKSCCHRNNADYCFHCTMFQRMLIFNHQSITAGHQWHTVWFTLSSVAYFMDI